MLGLRSVVDLLVDRFVSENSSRGRLAPGALYLNLDPDLNVDI